MTINRKLSGATTPDQNGPGTNGNEAFLEPHHLIVWSHIQNTCWGSLTALPRINVYFTAPVDWAIKERYDTQGNL